ncbi:hypothetical protein [Geobacter sp.]|uniref:hypothetical protein n=1 Tax=Geobacter sp. TaxID=46610 RepID=UPI0026128A49|nr:hypothetical protein [Geobacter sp.]
MKRLLLIVVLLSHTLVLAAVAADWNKPTLTDTYTSFLTYLNAKITDSALWLDSGSTVPTNLPTGSKRWNASTNKFEKWTGSAWSDLAANNTYGISISGNAATATTATNATKLNNWTWYWSGQPGQPSWVWGGSDGTNMYVYNPSNFSVAVATNAGNADTLDGQHGSYYQPASTAITTSNIGSQSVSYATNAGQLNGQAASYYQPASTAITTSNISSQSVSYATSAGNADTVDGKHASTTPGNGVIPVGDIYGRIAWGAKPAVKISGGVNAGGSYLVTLTTGVAGTIPINSISWDADNMMGTNWIIGRWTMPGGSKARLSAHIVFSSNATGVRQVLIKKNGAAFLSKTVAAVNGYNTAVEVITPILPVSSGDYFDVQAMQTSGGNLTLVPNETMAVMELLE